MQPYTSSSRLFSDGAHLFGYAAGNPLVGSDPFGLLVQFVCPEAQTAVTEASRCYPMLSQMLQTLQNAQQTFSIKCEPGETEWNRVMNGPRDVDHFFININSQILKNPKHCELQTALVHEIAEGWAVLLGFTPHHRWTPTSDDSHAWGTDLAKIFCYRCCHCEDRSSQCPALAVGGLE